MSAIRLGQAQFRKNVSDVLADRCIGDHQFAGDVTVSEAPGDGELRDAEIARSARSDIHKDGNFSEG